MSQPFHLAGIIPVAGQSLDFNFPWHDSLMPIGANYLAVERSVVECAYAGCETIWIVCHDDMQPLIRHRLGEYVEDPVWLGRTLSTNPAEERKQIPIYYVPIHPKDRDKRDCLAWSVIYGANSAYMVSKTISKWLIPSRYYVSFPYGIYPVEFIKFHRKEISSEKTFCLYTGDKETVKNNKYLGFTFDFEQYKEFRDTVRKEGTGTRVPSKGKMSTKDLPVEERWSARFFPVDKVFNPLDVDKNCELVEVEWYHNIDNWEEYCLYLGSQKSKEMIRPSKALLCYREFGTIGKE